MANGKGVEYYFPIKYASIKLTLLRTNDNLFVLLKHLYSLLNYSGQLALLEEQLEANSVTKNKLETNIKTLKANHGLVH